MKLSHSFTAKITPETFVTFYNNGDKQCCSFIENGDTVTISFSTDSLQKLTETIHVLQQIYQSLSKHRQEEISQELQLLNPHSSLQPIQNSNGKHHEVQ